MRPFRAWALSEGTRLPAMLEVEGVAGGPISRLDIDGSWVRDVCGTLARAGAALRAMPVRDVVEALGRVGERLLTHGDPLRREALDAMVATAGLSAPMCEVVLDGMATDWTRERLRALLGAELGDAGLLDDGARVDGGWRSWVVGPTLCVQVVSGSVPGVSVTALVRSLLVKGPTLLKPGLGDVALPAIFARALVGMEPRLARAVAVVYWPGGSAALEDAALGAADSVVAYGSDDAVRALRSRTPTHTRFVGYHHRIGVGAVAREHLSAGEVLGTARAVARAAAIFDQRGCVSPRVVWVEEGGVTGPRDFAALLARELEALERRWPTGFLDATEASAVHQARGAAEVQAAAGRDVAIWHGAGDPWTVIYDGVGDADPGCVGRVVRVLPAPDLSDLPARLEPWRHHLQAVALSAPAPRARRLARSFVGAGASLVAPFDAVAFPPAWWRQDGRGVFEGMIRWGGGPTQGDPGS